MVLPALAALSLSAALQASPSDQPTLSIEARSGGFGVSDELIVRFYRRAGALGSAPRWVVHLRRSYRGPPDRGEELDEWIDGRECPSVEAAARGLRSFDPPLGYDLDDVGASAKFAPHGARFVLMTTGALNGGKVTTTIVDLTGLALGELSNRTLSHLRSCLA